MKIVKLSNVIPLFNLSEIENYYAENIISEKVLDLIIENKNQTLEKNEISPNMIGILIKLSPSLFGGQSLRYCTLKNNKFIYLEDKDQYSAISGILNFDVISFTIKKIINEKVKDKIESFEYNKKMTVIFLESKSMKEKNRLRSKLKIHKKHQNGMKR